MVRTFSDPGTGPPVLSAKAVADVLLSSNFLESVPDAMVAVDGEGTILQVNSQTEQLFGYDREELIGKKIEMLIPERYRGRHHQHRDHFARSEERRVGKECRSWWSPYH